MILVKEIGGLGLAGLSSMGSHAVNGNFITKPLARQSLIGVASLTKALDSPLQTLGSHINKVTPDNPYFMNGIKVNG